MSATIAVDPAAMPPPPAATAPEKSCGRCAHWTESSPGAAYGRCHGRLHGFAWVSHAYGCPDFSVASPAAPPANPPRAGTPAVPGPTIGTLL